MSSVYTEQVFALGQSAVQYSTVCCFEEEIYITHYDISAAGWIPTVYLKHTDFENDLIPSSRQLRYVEYTVMHF